MTKRLLILLSSLVIAMSASAQKLIPNVDVINAKGESVSVLELIPEGKPVVVSFWDTSCKPCIQELSAYSDCYDDWKEEFDFEIIAVSTDDSRSSSKAIPLAKGRGWPFTVVLDRNGDFKRALNVQSNPTIFILNTERKVVDTHVGYNPGNEMLVYEVLKQMSVK